MFLNESRNLKYKRPYYLKLQRVYNNIINRCYREKDPDYFMYGGRGILVSDEWKNSFKKFYDDIMNLGYKNGLDIDRIDNDEGYTKENCQLLTPDANKLKSKYINLTVEDVHFIRSSEFDWDTHRKNYTCSDNVLKNIIEFKTFKNV